MLGEWPIKANMFDGDDIAGPVPLLFATNVDDATTAVTANPDKAFKDLQRIYSKFFMPENIPASAAMAQLANPRASEVAFPFRRTTYAPPQEPAHKKARHNEGPPTTEAGPSAEYNTGSCK
jgi:hypothetical protein